MEDATIERKEGERAQEGTEERKEDDKVERDCGADLAELDNVFRDWVRKKVEDSSAQSRLAGARTEVAAKAITCSVVCSGLRTRLYFSTALHASPANLNENPIF